MPFPLSIDIAVFDIKGNTVLRAQAFQQDNGEPKAAIARFGPPAAGDRWRAPILGVGLFGHRAPVWTLWSSSPAPRQGNWTLSNFAFGSVSQTPPDFAIEIGN